MTEEQPGIVILREYDPNGSYDKVCWTWLNEVKLNELLIEYLIGSTGIRCTQLCNEVLAVYPRHDGANAFELCQQWRKALGLVV